MYFCHIKYNYPKLSKIQCPKKPFSKYLKKIGNVLHIFIFIFSVLIIWQVNSFCITLFFTMIITMTLAPVFIVFTALFLNMFVKLSYNMGIFTHFSIIICIRYLCIIFRIFYHFMFGCLLFFLSLHCSFVFVLVFYMFFYLFTNFYF